MGYMSIRTRVLLETDRARVIAYLQYALQDVAELSPSSASLLAAAIEDLQLKTTHQALGNDLRNPS